jgi:hypothetical protein
MTIRRRLNNPLPSDVPRFDLQHQQRIKSLIRAMNIPSVARAIFSRTWQLQELTNTRSGHAIFSRSTRAKAEQIGSYQFSAIWFAEPSSGSAGTSESHFGRKLASAGKPLPHRSN